jgi:hypothetical protein
MQFNYINGKINDRTVDGTPDVFGDYDIYGVRWMVDF